MLQSKQDELLLLQAGDTGFSVGICYQAPDSNFLLKRTLEAQMMAQVGSSIHMRYLESVPLAAGFIPSPGHGKQLDCVAEVKVPC